MNPLKRCNFLQGAAATAGAATQAGVFPSSIPGANEPIRGGIIAAGDEGMDHLRWPSGSLCCNSELGRWQLSSQSNPNRYSKVMR